MQPEIGSENYYREGNFEEVDRYEPRVVEAGMLTVIIAGAWALGVLAVVAAWYWFLAVAWVLRWIV